LTRTAGEIGQGLAAARRPRPIRAGERIHVVGAGGAGASAAALLASRAGAAVSGCDPGGASPYTVALEAAGIPLAWQHSADHVRLNGPGAAAVDRLAVTKALTAIDPDNAELAAAHALGIPTEPWQQLVADVAVSSGQSLVAVAGTHGKSTTSGWLVHLLMTAGRDPSAFVGALLPAELSGGIPATSRWGHGDAFVVEADEYAGNFDPYRPNVTLLLNAEWDHPDVFADRGAVVDAFLSWLQRAAAAIERPMLVANVGDPGVAEVVGRLAGWSGNIVRVALGSEAEISGRLEVVDGRSLLDVIRSGATAGTFEVGLAGAHNAGNALALVGAASVLGVGDDALRRSLAEFGGVGRRMELKGEVAGVAVVDDYGHHPTAIARTLEAVRQRFPARRVWAVYEPLTYHRTALMLEQFADVLARADVVAIADVWAGRDPDTTITNSASLADAVNRRHRARAVASGSVEATADYLAANAQTGDVVLVMGGGRSYVIAQRLLELLQSAAR
jgi:UDP-N-acetylmuramate--alanine ligase